MAENLPIVVLLHISVQLDKTVRHGKRRALLSLPIADTFRGSLFSLAP
jgi:hypothetical protein